MDEGDDMSNKFLQAIVDWAWHKLHPQGRGNLAEMMTKNINARSEFLAHNGEDDMNDWDWTCDEPGL